MTSNAQQTTPPEQTLEPTPSPEKPVEEWVTGDEKMTGPQASYLKTLGREAGEEIDPGLTKGEASQKIEELQDKTGRGLEKANDFA